MDNTAEGGVCGMKWISVVKFLYNVIQSILAFSVFLFDVFCRNGFCAVGIVPYFLVDNAHDIYTSKVQNS
jgi:hypothetical protein